MNISLLDIIILLAASQGLFLSALIFHKYGKIFANRFIGALVALYSLLLLHLFLDEAGLEAGFDLFVPYFIGIGFLVGPLHFLYTRFIIHRKTAFANIHYLHFFPFVFYEGLLLASPEIASQADESIYLYWAYILHFSGYVTASLVNLKRYSKEINNYFSSTGNVRLDWLKNISLLALGVMFVFLLENILMFFEVQLSENFDLSSGLIAVYVYLLGYMALLKSGIFADPATERSLEDMEEQEAAEKKSHGKYEKSGMDETRVEEYKARLLQVMDEEKPYRESSLNLSGLAGKTGISPHNLSELVNVILGKNFFDFINGYRVEEVKNELADPGNRDKKILAIAYEAGFKSKSSFNTVFKRFTGSTPSEYKNDNSTPRK